MSDKLLITVSRRGQLTWPTFRHHVAELVASPELCDQSATLQYPETTTLNALQSLGHVMADFSEGAGTIWIAPRVLARLPVEGKPRAVLVGHRLADTRQQLQDACDICLGASLHVTANDHRIPLAPDRLLVEGETGEDLAGIAELVEARYHPDPAAWRVFQHSATVRDYEGTLEWVPQRMPDWERRDFDTSCLGFVPGRVQATSLPGLAELRDPQTNRNRYFLSRGDKSTEVDRGWGCYVTLASLNRSVLIYTDNEEFGAPLGAPLPPPYATGLGLCSGHVPYVAQYSPRGGASERIRSLVYPGVPRALAELVADRLGQTLNPGACHSESA